MLTPAPPAMTESPKDTAGACVPQVFQALLFVRKLPLPVSSPAPHAYTVRAAYHTGGAKHPGTCTRLRFRYSHPRVHCNRDYGLQAPASITYWLRLPADRHLMPNSSPSRDYGRVPTSCVADLSTRPSASFSHPRFASLLFNVIPDITPSHLCGRTALFSRVLCPGAKLWGQIAQTWATADPRWHDSSAPASGPFSARCADEMWNCPFPTPCNLLGFGSIASAAQYS
jgi:hypothetical protein